MRKNIYGIISVILLTSALFHPLLTTNAANDAVNSDPTIVVNKVRSVIADSIWMTDYAVDVLSQGLAEMSTQERELFLRYFDPGDTGEIDEGYIANVLENFRKIRSHINENIPLIYESRSSRCVMMTLYYTDFVRIHVCPYVMEEENLQRIARGIVHEAAHIAFLSFDRSYYYPNFSLYKKLVPNAHPATRIPLIGYIIREILRDDTLYNADTYAKFSAELVSMEDKEPQVGTEKIEKSIDETFSPEVKFSGVRR